GVGDGVEHDVAVGVTEQAALEGHVDTAEPQGPARHQAVHVPALTDADGRRSRHSAPAQNGGAAAALSAASNTTRTRAPADSVSAVASPTINPSPSDSDRNAPELCVPVERAR